MGPALSGAQTPINLLFNQEIIMKKLILTAAIAAISVPSAYAAITDDASLTMNATVTERCEVSLVGTNPNILFTLDQTVANIDTVCNIQGNIWLRMTSANAGNLVNGADNVPYTIDVNPNNVGNGFTGGVGDNLSIAAPVTLVAPGGALLSGAQIDLRVNVNQNNNNGDGLYAGNYTDTIQMDIGPAGTF